MRRIAVVDVLRVGAVGLRTRPLRAVLSALGIAIGIAAMVAVIGISASGRADLQRTLDNLGTNLLSIESGQTNPLPDVAPAMVARIEPVQNAAALSKLPDRVHVYRNEHVPVVRTEGVVTYAADLNLPGTVGARLAQGAWLNAAIATYPGVVLGTSAAQRLGITDPGMLVVIGGVRFAAIGVLAPVPLVPDLDSAALIGFPAAKHFLHAPGHPTAIYLRADDNQVTAVRDVLAATANPAAPYTVVVSRPSDALAAKLATERTFNALLLGLGAVALLVGGVGVANTMVVSVLERRAEIGLRRALGARRGQIRLQFLIEALLLTTLGGLAGTALGALGAVTYAFTQNWPPTFPLWTAGAGIGATACVGAAAGLYPAIRAARLAPAEALGTP